MPFEGAYNNSLSLAMRTVEVFMNRIRRFQKMINLYRGETSTRKLIAYMSLGWEFKELVKGFVDNVKGGNVPESTRNHFGLTDDLIEKTSKSDLIGIMNKAIGIDEILTRVPSVLQIKTARAVGTNLTALSESQITSLSLFAEVMTEIQIKLYCPKLLTETANSHDGSKGDIL